LIDAGAPAQRRRALHQLDRGLSRRLAALRDAILTLEALIAYEIDFPEEDEGPVDPARVAGAWRTARDGVAELLATAPDGERLREGALLVIAGPPNAGKSSLFNALLGTERALVTEIPGTTRDAIEAHAVIDGFPFRLVDTAGLRTGAERVESLGIEVARRYLGAADLVLYCEETGRGTGSGRRRAGTFLAGAAPVSGAYEGRPGGRPPRPSRIVSVRAHRCRRPNSVAPWPGRRSGTWSPAVTWSRW
jgi:tRNA modification GTPase